MRNEQLSNFGAALLRPLARCVVATAVAALALGGRAEAQSTYTWANSNVAGTPASSLDWFTGGTNPQGTWTGGTPVSSNLNTVQFFANTSTALTNTAAPSSQTVNLNNSGSAFELGTLTLSGRGSSTANANLTMTLSGDALNFSGATGTINLNALNATRTITYNVDNAIQLGTAGSGSVLTLTGEGTGTFNFGGSISELQAGGGRLVKSGASTVSLDAANTYTGTTTVNRGVLLLNHANALPGGVGASGGTSNLTFNETGNTANFQAVVGLTSDFTRSIGTSASQVQWTDGGGFAAFGADRTVNFGGNATPSTIVWGNSSANGGFGGHELILGAASATHMVELVNPLDLGSTGRTITVGNGAAAIDAKISSNITGSGPLTVNGNTVGTLQLAGSNSSNGLSIVATQVIVNSANALGTGTVTLSGQGGLASPTLLTVANPVTMSTNGAKIGNSEATGDIVLAGPLALNLNVGSLNSPSKVNLVGLSTVDITGQISGTGAANYVGFVVPADTTLRFGADNSAWTQNVSLINAGDVVLGHAKALGGGPTLSFGDNNASSAIVLTSEVDLTGANALSQLVYLHRAGSSTDLNLLTFSGTNSIELAGGVEWNSPNKGFTNDISGGSLIVSGNMTLGAGSNNYVSSSGTTMITGNIVDPGSGAGLLLNSPTVLSGASSTSKTGLFILSGTNTYTGATTVSAGTLLFSGTQAKAPGTVTAAAAATIGLGVGGDNSYTSANVAALFANTLSGFSMNAASGVAVDTTGGNFTVSDDLAGTRAFTKFGPNTLTLSGNNSFSGAFTVTEGAISVATVNDASTDGPLGNRAGAVVLGSAGKTGTLSYTGATASTTKPFTAAAGGTAAFSVTDAATVLTLSGLIDGDGDKSFGGAGSYVIGGGFGGSGTVFKTGAGALTLTLAGHAGGYDIQSGRLNLNAASAIGNATALDLGSGIELDNTSAGAVTINNSGVAISLGSSLDFIGTQNLNMGTGTVTLGATSAIDVQAGTLTFGGNVVDGGSGYGITKDGPGTLVLSGLTSGAFSGNSVLNAGELFLDGTSTLGGTSATTITVNPGSTLRIGGTASTGGVTVNNAGGTVIVQSLQPSGQTFSANTSLTADDALFNGVQKIDAGVVVSASQDWLGSDPGTPTAGRIVMENGATLSSTNAININANKGIALSGASATFDTSNGSIFINSEVTGTGKLVKTGTDGFRILNTSNSYAGGTEILEGTFGIYGDGSLGQAGTQVLIDGATLNSGQGTSGQTVTVSSARSIVLGNGKTSNLDATNGSVLAYAGVITEVDGLGAAATLRIGTNPNRPGTVLLGGANTYRGDTIINAGSLKLASAGSFANSPRIIVGDATGSAAATLDLTEKTAFSIDSTQTLMGKGRVLLGAGTELTVAGTFSPGNSPGLFTYDGGGTATLAGTTLMEIEGTTRGTTYDAVDVLGGTVLDFGDGILQLDFDQTFADGTVFNLFTPSGGASLADTFSEISMVGIAYGDLAFTQVGTSGIWNTNVGNDNQSMTFDSGAGTLSISVVPEPALWGLLASAAAAAWGVWKRRQTRRGIADHGNA